MSAAPTVLGTTDAARAIARSLAALHREHLDRGPTRVKCYLDEDSVLVLMYGGHTHTEEILEAAGEENAVASQRVRSAAAIHDQLVEAVEEATERKVIGCMSSSQQHPSLLSHVFVLEPTDLLDPDS